MATSIAAGTQSYVVEKLHHVGWFIPPFVSVHWIGNVAAAVDRAGIKFGQPELEQVLRVLFTPETLATMVLNRYPKTRIIEEFQLTIAEGVQAHFLKLDHIVSSGLVPVIEGATRRLADNQGVETKTITGTITALVKHCKRHVTSKNIGNVGEIISMLESFEMFLSKVLFVSTQQYNLTDGTNRNGMTHGTYADKDFGSPLNFYKIMTAINSLTFISSLYYGGSGFVPNDTAQSTELARHYRTLSQIASERPG